jgi:hypothetical protein
MLLIISNSPMCATETVHACATTLCIYRGNVDACAKALVIHRATFYIPYQPEDRMCRSKVAGLGSITMTLGAVLAAFLSQISPISDDIRPMEIATNGLNIRK